MKPKTINSLMSYMRKTQNITINGSIQKKKLRYMGYFHGYKGYRYFSNNTNLLPYSSFNEIQSVYNFDMELKTLIYSRIMFLETTIKNYTLECVLEESKSEKFADIFSTQLTAYKEETVGSGRYNNKMKRRLELREHVYKAISRDYSKAIVKHYYNKDESVPIWAIFELLSIGELGTFIECLNLKNRLKLSREIGVKRSYDSDGKLPQMFVYALTSLRNAVAHNKTIFDTRFNSDKINSRVQQYIESETGIKNIKFEYIVDYIILISFLMKLLKCTKSEIVSFINQYEEACEMLRNQVPAEIYSRIIYSDNRTKLKQLKLYCKK